MACRKSSKYKISRWLEDKDCFYPDENEQNLYKYGRLYDWHDVMDERNICPPGWRVASDNDWKQLPPDVEFERQPVQKFTNPDGVTHYYETVYLPSGNLNWFLAAYLAQNTGGYLVAITSEEENSFVIDQVNDEKFFWKFPKYDGNSARMNHYEIKIGPFIGGYQQDGAPESAGDWQWLSGEA